MKQTKTAAAPTAVLIMHCPDRSGILAAVTDFININGGNILSLDQHVDKVENIFFMRVEWELEGFVIPRQSIEEYFTTLMAKRLSINFHIYFSDEIPRMAIFVSKMSHCLYDMLARYNAAEWRVEIPLIVSNHPDMEQAAKRFDIPYHHIPITPETRLEQEEKTLALLQAHKIDFIVLARYMQIIPSKTISLYPDRIINIHHSFLPAFIGAKPYHAAYERGVKLIGATSHYVTEELDAGPIISQDVARISHKNTIDDLVRKGRDLEKIVLSRAVGKHIDRKILTYKNRTVVF